MKTQSFWNTPSWLNKEEKKQHFKYENTGYIMVENYAITLGEL